MRGQQPTGSLPPPPWLRPETLRLTRTLLDSHRQAFSRSLLAGCDERLSDRQAAQELFTASRVVLAHDGSPDPRLIYANRSALMLWRCDWCTLVGLPSRLTAEPERRGDRRRMLGAGPRSRGDRGLYRRADRPPGATLPDPAGQALDPDGPQRTPLRPGRNVQRLVLAALKTRRPGTLPTVRDRLRSER